MGRPAFNQRIFTCDVLLDIQSASFAWPSSVMPKEIALLVNDSSSLTRPRTQT
jgi:hypothetical protein